MSYGSWKSPVTAGLIAGQTITPGQVVLDEDDVYWSEQRPAEGGRNAIVHQARGRIEDVLSAEFDARTRVHEYGGGAFTVADGVTYFSNHRDCRLYRARPGSAPVALTSASDARYADLVFDHRRRRIVCVREMHAHGNAPVNELVAVDAEGTHASQVLHTGHDFYSSPRLAPDGRSLAWLAWDHPSMPWDATELYLAEIDRDGLPRGARRIAGGAGESIFQPEFAPDGTLYFVSDRSGWWNLYRYENDRAHALTPMEAEFGVPQWVFGLSTYAFATPDCIVAAYNQQGTWRLGTIDVSTGRLRAHDTPYTEVGYLRAYSGRAIFVAATPTALPAVVEFDLASGRCTTLRGSSAVCLEPGYISRPRAIAFETANGETAHAFYYAPRNHDVEPPVDERPPLLVTCHGGPTSVATSALNLKIQYWTSRGIAVLDVNYRGSAGFGRAYRERLYGQWGEVDVEDCVHGARDQVTKGLADGARLAIRGASAGGLTALSALTFHGLFKAGASYYGVSDLERLARDTHKFEAHYLDRLVGPYPEARAVYRARSPLAHVERLMSAMIFFQGLDDKVVPPDQTERMVAALTARGVPVAYLPFAGEAHGFRRAGPIQRALEAELYFYGRVFGFTPADAIDPVSIANLPS